MNQIGETIDKKKLLCREFDVQQIKYLFKVNPFIVMSWGLSEISLETNMEHTRVVRLSVNGFKHKGFVYIFLNGLDLFDVILTDKKDVITQRTNGMGIYVDELINWIDENVEKQPSYVH
jgi:hypothetical protein